MSSIQALLPPELIHSISKFLTPIEYYRCLFVSQFWYRTFKQFLYRRIFIHSDEQLEKLVESLQSSPGSKDKEQSSNGLLIRELCLAQKSLSCEENPVKISTDVLSLIGELCSNLEVFTFDITNWQHLQLTTKLIEDLRWKHLRKFAPIPHTIFDIIPASTLAKSNLTHLHLSSSLVPWKCLLEKLKTIPTISHLALEIDYNSGQQQEDALIRMHLQEISYSLPLLEGLKLIRRKVSRSQAPFSSEIPFNLTQLLQPSQLKSLSLEGLVDDLYWFEFICKSYPLLKSLSLAQSGSNTLDSKWRWQGAFLLMIRNLPKLKSLFLCGANAMNLLSDGLGHELRKKECSIDSLAVKSNTYQRMDSCQLLFLIAKHGYRQLKYLRLAVWEDMPGWSSAPYSLLRCTQLVELDLAFSRGISSQYPYTPFLIDRWLSHLPQLERLTLRGVKLQVEYNSFDDLDKSNKSFALKSLKLQLSKIENHEVVLRYISFCCLQLEDLAFLECVTDEKSRIPTQTCRILLEQSSWLKKIQLSPELACTYSPTTGEYTQAVCIELKVKTDMTLPQQKGYKTVLIFWCTLIVDESDFTQHSFQLCEDKEQIRQFTSLYKQYIEHVSEHWKSSSMSDQNNLPFGIIAIYTQSIPSKIILNNLHLPPIHLLT